MIKPLTALEAAHALILCAVARDRRGPEVVASLLCDVVAISQEFPDGMRVSLAEHVRDLADRIEYARVTS